VVFDAQVDGTAPKNLTPQYGKASEVILNHQDGTTRERPGHARETAGTIGNQELGLTELSAIQENLTRRRIGERVFRRKPLSGRPD
jgi:hypothetical protein